MFVSYLSPLAPAAILLLSAFILLTMSRLPFPRAQSPWLPYFLGPGLVGAAIVSLVATRLSLAGSVTGFSLLMPAGWPLSTEVTAWQFQADSLGLSFLILTLLLALVVALSNSPLSLPREIDPTTFAETTQSSWRITSGWLLVGAALCMGAVSANLMALSVAVMTADLLFMAYWLRQQQKELALTRLFLTMVTTSAIVLNSALVLSDQTSAVGSSGLLLLGLALWLRLGLVPFIELTEHSQDDEGPAAYYSFSWVLGLILVSRVLDQPLPVSLLWVTTVMLLLSGAMAWLSDRLPLQLSYLMVTQLLLLLLTGPLPPGVAVAAGLMLLLSFVALRVTPHLGRPNFGEGAWLWPYLPAAMASLTLIGLPLFIGWPVRLIVYQELVALDSIGILLLAILAEMLALTSLVRFWRGVGSGQKNNQQRLIIGVIVMVPFLLPGLGPFVLERITHLSLPTVEIGQASWVLALMVVIIIGAVVLQTYRENLLAQLKISPTVLAEVTQLRWLWPRSNRWLQRLNQLLLRADLVFEGQHYLGWAIFATIIGALIILLRV